MKKKILLFALAVTFFMAGSIDSAAVVCSASPDGVHHLNKHSITRTYDTPGQHNYVWGYDVNGNEIIQVCHTNMHWANCKYVCSYCNADDPNNKLHTEYLGTTHEDCGK